MAYFAAVLDMKDESKNLTFRPHHLEYLATLSEQGKVHLKGPFKDGSGGMVIYIADSLEEAQQLAENDPYVVEGVRSLHLREWGI
ncbi:YciI family protein [Paenibacillus sp. ACRRX]|uniref:YciI family protein n=1 Tax=unclassified Paenibacillus TaxID=185978 RepID=UPI001EF49205|nr:MULTISPECIES: YciI family protein [unclassified Paenibacillus]MCG7409943.1 YciI family protein [Paenibacillus sp. ACRRX]MDK8182991.1 YciI family protein [Paenibacillus sp. UMB4589-SE434]